MNQTVINNNKAADISGLFLAGLYTKNQALRVLILIKDYLNFRIYKSPSLSFQESINQFGKNLGQETKQSFSANKLLTLSKDFDYLNRLGEGFFVRFNAGNFNQLTDSLQESITKAKTIILYLAYEIPDDHIDQIGGWFKVNLGPNCLVDIQFDGGLIGGCALSVNGIYKDYSIRALIEANKNQIISSLLSFKS